MSEDKLFEHLSYIASKRTLRKILRIFWKQIEKKINMTFLGPKSDYPPTTKYMREAWRYGAHPEI